MGLLGAVSKQWFITDFACTLAGLPLVTMHRATTQKSLAHLIDESGMAVLVASKHLATVIQEAQQLAQKSQLKVVVWIEDSEDAYCNNRKSLGDLELTCRQILWTHLLQLGGGVSNPEWRHRDPKAIIKLLPSSGSTGLPKLVAVTEESFFKGASPNLQSSLEVVVYATWFFNLAFQHGCIRLQYVWLPRMNDLCSTTDFPHCSR